MVRGNERRELLSERRTSLWDMKWKLTFFPLIFCVIFFFDKNFLLIRTYISFFGREKRERERDGEQWKEELQKITNRVEKRKERKINVTVTRFQDSFHDIFQMQHLSCPFILFLNSLFLSNNSLLIDTLIFDSSNFRPKISIVSNENPKS